MPDGRKCWAGNAVRQVHVGDVADSSENWWRCVSGLCMLRTTITIDREWSISLVAASAADGCVSPISSCRSRLRLDAAGLSSSPLISGPSSAQTRSGAWSVDATYVGRCERGQIHQRTGARFTKYLTTILRLSYDNAKVTIDLRRTYDL